MPNISSRGSNMPSSPIRKLVPFAEAAKMKGKKVIHLNIGQPDIKTPVEMLDAIKNLDLEIIEYTQSEGTLSYRKKLVEYYAKNNIHVTTDEIIVTTGGSEALSFGIFSCLDMDDEVIVPEPFYANYNGFLKAGNVNVIPVTSTIEDGFALPSIDDLEFKITSRTKAIIICNPNNPTGYLYSREELEKIKQIVIKHNMFLFVDEVYREFVYDDQYHTSILELGGLDEYVVVVDSISKRYSACGARIGALITRNKRVHDTAMKFAQARLSPPQIEQIAAEASVDVPDSYMEEVKAEYVSRRDFVVEELNKIEGVICPNPGGAFYCMVQLPVKDTETFCKWLLTDFEYDGYTVMLAPAAGFYSSIGSGLNQARIAYVLEKPMLKRGIECLKIALEQYKKIETDPIGF